MRPERQKAHLCIALDRRQEMMRVRKLGRPRCTTGTQPVGVAARSTPGVGWVVRIVCVVGGTVWAAPQAPRIRTMTTSPRTAKSHWCHRSMKQGRGGFTYSDEVPIICSSVVDIDSSDSTPGLHGHRPGTPPTLQVIHARGDREPVLGTRTDRIRMDKGFVRRGTPSHRPPYEAKWPRPGRRPRTRSRHQWV